MCQPLHRIWVLAQADFCKLCHECFSSGGSGAAEPDPARRSAAAGIMLYERALRHLTQLERPLAATGNAFFPQGDVQAEEPTREEIDGALGDCQTDEQRDAAWGELLEAKDRQAYQAAFEGNYRRAVDGLMAAKFTYVVASQVGTAPCAGCHASMLAIGVPSQQPWVWIPVRQVRSQAGL